MTKRFSHFVLFAGMRTGSNYLERNISSVPDIKSYGELFNPYFIVREGEEEFLGMTLEDREKDPTELVERVCADTPALAGFRLFHDHDPRVRSLSIHDPDCAKIVLTRNPLESYVSYKHALASNQWVLTDAKGQIEIPSVEFVAEEFRDFAEAQARFLTELRTGLAEAGQTALYVDYAHLTDLNTLNGVLEYLGSAHRLDRPERSLKRQNPIDLLDRVSNPDQMTSAVSALDPFGLDPTVSARLERGAAVRSYIAGASLPLLYLPVHGPFSDPVSQWLSEQDDGAASVTDMTQKLLRNWRTNHPDARTFTILSHPVRRAWDAFEQVILPTNLQAFAEVRLGLQTAYKVPLPERWPDPDLPKGKLRRAFVSFCKFLKLNLAGQTSIRIDEAWVAQHTRLHGMSSVSIPDIILREDNLENAQSVVGVLSGAVGNNAGPIVVPPVSEALSSIYDAKVEAMVRAAYARDYAVFGFVDWRAD